MYIDADYHGKKRAPFFTTDFHIMKMIIIENPIINSFRTGSGIIGFFKLLCSPRNRGIETYIPVRFGIDYTPVVGG